jgi:glutamyl-tRNA synthetase
MSRKELIDNFSLERVSQTSAIFNREKLDWMNGVYIRNLGQNEFTGRVLRFLEKDLPPQVKRPLPVTYIKKITPLVQERAKTFAEVPGLVDFFFIEELDYPAGLLIGKKMDKATTEKALQASLDCLDRAAEFDEASLEAAFRVLADELGLKAGQLFGALRIAVTGREVSPPLFQTMTVLGKERCIGRVKAALDKLGDYKEEPSEQG